MTHVCQCRHAEVFWKPHTFPVHDCKKSPTGSESKSFWFDGTSKGLLVEPEMPDRGCARAGSDDGSARAYQIVKESFMSHFEPRLGSQSFAKNVFSHPAKQHLKVVRPWIFRQHQLSICICFVAYIVASQCHDQPQG